MRNPGAKGTVVYCNPNAGVWELSGACLGLDVGAGQEGGGDGWIDVYCRMGYDVVGFNYRGYGRSCFGDPWKGGVGWGGRVVSWFSCWFGSGGLKVSEGVTRSEVERAPSNPGRVGRSNVENELPFEAL